MSRPRSPGQRAAPARGRGSAVPSCAASAADTAGPSAGTRWHEAQVSESCPGSRQKPRAVARGAPPPRIISSGFPSLHHSPRGWVPRREQGSAQARGPGFAARKPLQRPGRGGRGGGRELGRQESRGRLGPAGSPQAPAGTAVQPFHITGSVETCTEEDSLRAPISPLERRPVCGQGHAIWKPPRSPREAHPRTPSSPPPPGASKEKSPLTRTWPRCHPVRDPEQGPSVSDLWPVFRYSFLTALLRDNLHTLTFTRC